MRVLVTGGAGFVGLAVLRALREGGDEVLAPVRDESAKRRIAAIDPGIRAPRAPLDDLAGIGAVVRAFRPQTAVHLAWYANPSDYRTSRENLVSLKSTIDLTELLLSVDCRKMVYTGTCFEYRVDQGPRRESDPTDPRSLYAAAKLAAGAVCAALAEARGAELAWARIYFPYGPGENPNRLLPLVARKLARGEQVDLTEGKQVRDQVHVEDVASALVRLTARGTAGVYNVGTGVPVTMRDAVETLAELIGKSALLRFGAYPEQADEPASMYADITRMRGLGWAPTYPDLRSGLQASLPSYLAAGDGAVDA